MQAAAKGIAFVFDVSSDLPETAATDEKRLRQIIINLLSNAIKFTRQGRVTLIITYRNEVAEFIVQDTGPGIATEDLERIFDPFERLQAGASEPGTGLGLTICHLLSAVMGGDIAVTSELGVGTIFKLKLFLPRVNDAKQPANGSPAVADGVGLGSTILIVDDNATHRGMIIEALAPYGFVVLQAETGPVALELAAAMQPDLFLLDIGLPGMDGWRLAELLRAAGPFHEPHRHAIGQRHGGTSQRDRHAVP